MSGNGHGFALAGGAVRTADGGGHTGRGLHAATDTPAPGPALFGQTGERALMMWVRTTGSYTGWVWEWKDAGLDTGLWGLLSLNGNLGFRGRNPSGSTAFAAIARPADSVWHHFAGTFDGTSVRLYVDGVLTGSPVALSGGIATTATDLYAFEVDTGGMVTVDEARVFDEALDEAMIAALMGEPPEETSTVGVDGGTAVDVYALAAGDNGTAVDVRQLAAAVSGTAVDVRQLATGEVGTSVDVRALTTSDGGTAVDVRALAAAPAGTAVDVHARVGVNGGTSVNVEGEAVGGVTYSTDVDTVAYTCTAEVLASDCVIDTMPAAAAT